MTGARVRAGSRPPSTAPPGRRSKPGAWDLYDRALWGYEGIGWYAVELPLAPSGDQTWERVVFGQVNYHARVWLDGQCLGEHLNGYLPFEFDINSYRRPGEPSKLVVRVDNAARVEWLPGAEVIEWVLYGGILRPVWIEMTARCYIADVSIVATPGGSGAAVTSQVEIRNCGDAPFDGAVRVYLPGGAGPVSADVMVFCGPGERSHVRAVLQMPEAATWSPSAPVLHTATVELRGGERVVDATEQRFGVRAIEVAGRAILLNGEPLQIRGVCRYDEYGGLGVTVPEHVIRADLARIKETGANLIRTNYPIDPVVLNAADGIGLLVMEEIPLCWWKPRSTEDAANDAIVSAARQALRDLIRRDRNHPSIVLWSVANECETDCPAGIDAMRELIALARELDPMRLVSFVAAGNAEGHLAFSDADLVAVNVYYGLFHGEVAPHLRDFEHLVRKPTDDHLRAAAAQFPDKPLVVTEFGTQGVHGLRGDARFTEDYQAAYIEAVWRAIEAVPEVRGGVLWCWADYYHRRDFIGRGGRMIQSAYGPYGAVTVDRQAKRSLDTLNRLYGGDPAAGAIGAPDTTSV